MFYLTETGELIYKCKKAAIPGDVPYTDDSLRMEPVPENLLRHIFDGLSEREAFIDKLAESQGRYKNAQFGRIAALANTYSPEQVAEAIRYCLRVDICSSAEVAAYLLYRYGLIEGKRKMTPSAVYHYKKRAEEIARKQDGRDYRNRQKVP